MPRRSETPRPEGRGFHILLEFFYNMAKSKSGGSRAYIRGRVGSDVYSIGKDAKGKKQQVVRSIAEQVKNPQTVAQMRGRMIMSTVMQAVAAMGAIIDHSFDGVPAGQPSISEFISRNYQLLKTDVAAHPSSDNTFGLNKYQEKGIKKGKYLVSDGKAQPLSGITVDGTNKTLTITLGASATIADLKSALGINSNDFFTLVAIDATVGFVYARLHIANLADSTVIAAGNVASIFTKEGNMSVTPSLSGNNVVLTFGYIGDNSGIIVSRKMEDGYIHNSVTLSTPATPSWTSDVALATYPVGAQRFLNGGSFGAAEVVDAQGTGGAGGGGGGNPPSDGEEGGV